ncbi:xanthine dehydrogenase molybdopterin binding subunit [Hyphococcus sp.]|uniref:xanthine dehydrogenase molybdopterin binding subunit n=1 Tax=Hyphococcus sp. TaxID=2038636 RepID=UPI002081DCFD|nr:MAG: xanthine dehydrogenase molybdopterin binding subunit [Marinicaulis sp.]
MSTSKVIRRKDASGQETISGGVAAPVAHDSAYKHTSGRALYVDDIPSPPGCLYVHIAISKVARAKVAPVDFALVRECEGVIRVLTGDDIPGVNNVGPIAHDEPLFALGSQGGVVHSEGQALFAVVAETWEAARAAAGAATIEYEKLPAILTIDDAMQAQSWLEPPYKMVRGDAKSALLASAHQAKGRVEIGGQEHFYLEGHAALAVPGEDDDVTIYCSSQHPSEIQHKVAEVLGVPNNAVTVEVRRMGGGFGGKETNGNLPTAVIALAAKLTGRPARIRYDRDADMLMTGKRHDFRIDYQVGFDSDGRIEAIIMDQAARCGWSQDLSMAICDRAMFHADNCYYLPNVLINSYRCRTNTASNTAFRGFGGPQGMIAIERVMDEIAFVLGKDPLEVRRVNFYASHTEPKTDRKITPYHMTVEDCVIDEIIDELVMSSDYVERRAAIAEWNAKHEILKKGIALTPVKFGISFTKTHLNQAGALVHIYADGSVHLNHGGTEMGQGLFIKVAQVVAEEFQIDLDRIKITPTNTGKVPNTSATAASSGSDLNGMAALDACRKIKERLIEFAAEEWSAPVESINFNAGRVEIGDHEITFDDLIAKAYLARVSLSANGFYATPKIEWDRAKGTGRPFFYFAYGAAVSEVVVDTLTGENRILRVDILHDAGKSLNPAIDLGQIEGGFVQGAGWLTTEELVWDDQGRLKTHAPSTYKIPVASDRAPDMRMAIWDKGINREDTIFRSKAVGEPPLMLGISVLMALSNAIAAANHGARYPALDAPATPERVLRAMEGGRS